MEPEFKKEGVYEVRVVFSGDRKMHSPSPHQPYVLDRDLSAPGERAIYKCWRGKVYSQPVKIAIENPSSKEDLEVLEFVKSGKAFKLIGYPDDWSRPFPTASNFAHSHQFLRENYPNNYYTFVAGLYAAAGSGNSHLLLKQALELQPQHPLRQHALVQLAMEEIGRDLRIDKEIESEVPDVMKNFIKQYKGEVESWKKHKRHDKPQHE